MLLFNYGISMQNEKHIKYGNMYSESSRIYDKRLRQPWLYLMGCRLNISHLSSWIFDLSQFTYHHISPSIIIDIIYIYIICIIICIYIYITCGENGWNHCVCHVALSDHPTFLQDVDRQSTERFSALQVVCKALCLADDSLNRDDVHRIWTYKSIIPEYIGGFHKGWYLKIDGL